MTMVSEEGRLSRWSRLKQKGGASEIEDARIQAERKSAVDTSRGPEVARVGDDIMVAPDPTNMPGGDFRRNAIPVMAPLGGIEEGDDAFQAAPPEILALMEESAGHDGTQAVAPVDGDIESGGVELDEGLPIDEDIPIDEIGRELTDEEQEAVAGLPALETLNSQSDFTPFLADKVPEFIRRRALSVLWRSDPVLANIDGLNDYDEDFNIIDTLIDIAKDSSYRVGKGYATEEEGEEEGINEAHTAVEGDIEKDLEAENIAVVSPSSEQVDNQEEANFSGVDVDGEGVEEEI
jgi:hypothetical protein